MMTSEEIEAAAQEVARGGFIDFLHLSHYEAQRIAIRVRHLVAVKADPFHGI